MEAEQSPLADGQKDDPTDGATLEVGLKAEQIGGTPLEACSKSGSPLEAPWQLDSWTGGLQLDTRTGGM